MTNDAPQSLLLLPLIVLVGCVDREIATAPDGAIREISPLSTTLTVENLDNDGRGSLRAAIQAAGNGHVITFDPLLAGDTIELQSELVIDKSLTIVGPDGGITLSGGGATRIFFVQNVQEVVLDKLTLREGNGIGFFAGDRGGAILSFGNLTIRNTTLEQNWASGPNSVDGVIVQSGGSLRILNSTLSSNGVNPGVPGDQVRFGGAVGLSDRHHPREHHDLRQHRRFRGRRHPQQPGDRHPLAHDGCRERRVQRRRRAECGYA